MRAAAGVDLDRPNRLVDSGPYAFSRNPMYLAWTLGYVGVALLAKLGVASRHQAAAAARQLGVAPAKRGVPGDNS